MTATNITSDIKLYWTDEGLLPLAQCICGAMIEPWDKPHRCQCGRVLSFVATVETYLLEDEVVPDAVRIEVY